ncbi:SubName: Full=Uncharacterized protein {ECO:0000313/EMBL:CCA74156.1} [Serendipita indica DSM 11827]|uniref:Uncharacterized protein n=1 Tax=Serendipita indica (strain DSM 11827) TaxID=1109443 RepID=G4TS63_SERID|nr:SubName: Full=Uncharacterized protein {ECO:0000313/EMBL:CCA74156.1} [Serendipita indica DSM 11827]CCA74156.1 hypothetical protein PIIN_08109 [Serendipita indica DSM 11827]
MLPEPEPTPPPEEPNRGKHAVRALLGFLHFAVAILLITAAIIALIERGSLFVIYAFPFALLVLIAEIRRRMRRKKATLLDERLKVFNLIRVRGLLYQILGVIIILSRAWDDAVMALGWTVWTIGLVLFLLGGILKELGALNWLDDDQDPGKVRLDDSDDEAEQITSLLSNPV